MSTPRLSKRLERHEWSDLGVQWRMLLQDFKIVRACTDWIQYCSVTFPGRPYKARYF